MWPSLEEFKAWYLDTGMSSAVPVAAESVLRSAVKKWSRDTGFSPFVGDGSSSVWFDPSDYQEVLDFSGGFVSVASVAVATTPQGDTTDKTLLTDYVLERTVADGPYERLRWLRNPWFPSFMPRSGVQTILVTGVRGYCVAGTDTAKDAQEAIFQLAAASLDPIVSMSDGPVKKVTQGPVTLEYDTANGLDRAGAFTKFYEMKVAEYRRLVI